MKNKIFKIACLTFSILVMNSAHAYKYVIFTDESPAKKSEEIVSLMKKTYPFSAFDIEFEIVNLSADELDCGSTGGIDRFVTCKNIDTFQEKTMAKKGDQGMIVKKMDNHGGSSTVGSGVPIITSFSVAQTMLHEYLHTLGLRDEYAIEGEETKESCANVTSAPNLAFIAPKKSYAGDAAARAEHSGEIPWYKDIRASTPITNSGGIFLGTGKVDFDTRRPLNTTGIATTLNQRVGLYRAKRCASFAFAKLAWQPGAETTLMENSESGFGAALEKIVKDILISKGVREKMQIVETPVVPPIASPVSHIAAPEVVATPQPAAEVDNSSRPVFKSFFDWTKTLIKDTTKTSDR